jgi:hypothetical protein
LENTAARPSYNRVVKKLALALVSMMLLAGCKKSIADNNAVRQAIVDHLSSRGMNVSTMKIDITKVDYQNDKAVATVAFSPRDTPGGGMSMTYNLAHENNRWVVKGRQSGAGEHGAGMQDPHGAMPMPPPTGSSPDLPSGHPPVGERQPPAKK